MEKKSQLIKKENVSLVKIDKRPVLLVQEIARLVNSSVPIKQRYESVIIGSQVWMVQNLNVDHYRNGDLIPEVKHKKDWKNIKTGAWCYYKNNPENGKKYGKLYNWYAVNDPRGLAPEGWHIPTSIEFQTLRAAVKNDVNALKAVGQGIGIAAGTNTSGFSALVGGKRNGSFGYLQEYAYFWSSTEYNSTYAYNFLLMDNDNVNDSIFLINSIKHGLGLSVRCIKDC